MVETFQGQLARFGCRKKRQLPCHQTKHSKVVVKLLHCNAFSQIARLIDIGPLGHGGVIGEQLHRHDIQNRRDKGIDLGQSNRRFGLVCQPVNPIPVAEQHAPPAAGDCFFTIAGGFFK